MDELFKGYLPEGERPDAHADAGGGLSRVDLFERVSGGYCMICVYELMLG